MTEQARLNRAFRQLNFKEMKIKLQERLFNTRRGKSITPRQINAATKQLLRNYTAQSVRDNLLANASK